MAMGHIPKKTASGIPLVSSSPFSDAQGFRARFQGFAGTASKNSTTDIDILIEEDRYINGLELILDDHVFGDSICLQVVDKDGVGVTLGWYNQATFDALGEYVADEFGKDWYLDDLKCAQGQIVLSYPAKISAGLYVRIKYKSVGTFFDVPVKINLFLHKKTV